MANMNFMKSYSIGYTYIHIKTYDGESQGQEEQAICDERVSYL